MPVLNTTAACAAAIFPDATATPTRGLPLNYVDAPRRAPIAENVEGTSLVTARVCVRGAALPVFVTDVDPTATQTGAQALGGVPTPYWVLLAVTPAGSDPPIPSFTATAQVLWTPAPGTMGACPLLPGDGAPFDSGNPFWWGASASQLLAAVNTAILTAALGPVGSAGKGNCIANTWQNYVQGVNPAGVRTINGCTVNSVLQSLCPQFLLDPSGVTARVGVGWDPVVFNPTYSTGIALGLSPALAALFPTLPGVWTPNAQSPPGSGFPLDTSGTTGGNAAWVDPTAPLFVLSPINPGALVLGELAPGLLAGGDPSGGYGEANWSTWAPARDTVAQNLAEGDAVGWPSALAVQWAEGDPLASYGAWSDVAALCLLAPGMPYQPEMEAPATINPLTGSAPSPSLNQATILADWALDPGAGPWAAILSLKFEVPVRAVPGTGGRLDGANVTLAWRSWRDGCLRPVTFGPRGGFTVKYVFQ